GVTCPDPRTVSPPDFPRAAERFAAALPDDRRKQLAAALRLPEPAVRLVPHLGWDHAQGGWTFPECDGRGEVIGIGLRLPDGTKRCQSGSRRGLFLAGGWEGRDGPVFVVEGMSDALALVWDGLAAVGRPGAKAGADMLAELLRGVADERPIVVLAENDRKPDGRWPGREGAEFTVDRLRQLLKGRKVVCAAPPDEYKDARDWVAARLAAVPPTADPVAQAEAAREVGRDIALAVGRAVDLLPVKAPPRPIAPYPVPQPISHLGGTAGAVGWVWDGFLARGRITLLGALPKCGKTTLLTHLLKALDAGGTFCGRPLVAGSAVVVTEESPDEWAARRNALGLTDAVRVLPRPFFGKPSYDEWLAFLTHLIAHLDQHPADVVILDTLADLWPAKDENSAVEVHAALQPLRKLADGRAVVCVHHLRKSDGGEGTAARGSGALVGFVDVVAELRRAPKSTDPHGRRRVLKGYGRMTGIPDEWMIELSEDGLTFAHVDSDAAAADTRGQVEEGLKEELRAAILVVLP
ncbi:MAG: AAA family ATPase, partial [Gemmataceae bacterium]